MKLDLSEHDDDAHGAIKTAEGRAVVPFVMLLDSLRAGRPWRVVLQDVAQRSGRAWPQSWYWLRPGGWPEDMAAWLREQHELLSYQDRQRKSGRGEIAFMFTDLNEQIKSGQPRRRAKRLEFPLPGDADDLPGLLDCRLFDHAALERVTSWAALMAGDHGRVAIDLEDVRRVFPELEILGAAPPLPTWKDRVLDLHAKGKKPTAIAKELGLPGLLGVNEEAARKKVERLIKHTEQQDLERRKAEAFKQQVAHLHGSDGG